MLVDSKFKATHSKPYFGHFRLKHLELKPKALKGLRFKVVEVVVELLARAPVVIIRLYVISALLRSHIIL